MIDLLDKLTEPHVNTLLDTRELTALILNEPLFFGQVLEKVFDSDRMISSKAANAIKAACEIQRDLLEKNSPLFKSFIERMDLDEVAVWNVSGIIQHVWPQDDNDLNDWKAIFMQWFQTYNNAFIRINCVNALSRISTKFPAIQLELIEFFTAQNKKQKPMVKARIRKVVRLLSYKQVEEMEEN